MNSFEGPVIGSGPVYLFDIFPARHGVLPYVDRRSKSTLVPRSVGRELGSYARFRAPGCYGMQIDGTSFSEVIVLKAERVAVLTG